MTDFTKKEDKRTISIIVAMDKNGLIGNGNKLPWNIPEDLKHFKEKTMGKYLLMGERTYNSIKNKLLGRKIIVLSRSDKSIENGRVAKSIEEALSYAEGEIMIGGGASIYKQFLDIADKMYITVVNKNFEGDVYFPKFNMDEWKVIEEKKGEDSLIIYKTLVKKERE